MDSNNNNIEAATAPMLLLLLFGSCYSTRSRVVTAVRRAYNPSDVSIKEVWKNDSKVWRGKEGEYS